MNYQYLIAILAGVVLPVQIAFNNKLTTFTNNPFVSSLISFLVGTLALLLYTMSSPSTLRTSFQQAAGAPWYAWLGGLLGAFYIISTIVASPRIGIAMFLALVIGGQLFMSLLIDHYGWLGAAVKPITLTKVMGGVLVLAGIILMKR